MKRLANLRNEAGDTIVEVLIAIAIVSLTLTAAYTTSSRNSQTLQDSQEHSQALQLVQGQLELLRAYLSNPTNTFVSNECLTTSGSTVTETTTCIDSSAAQYKLNISAPDTNGVYTIKADWSSLVNGGNAEVSLYYAPR
jgi:Tfp pilus assembly protein PilV